MDWNHEILASLIWLGKAFVISSIGFGIFILLIGRFTEWGRQFVRLSLGYFYFRRSIAPLLLLALIVFMALFSVRMNVLFSFWYNGFYSAMQELDAKMFWFMLIVFAVLATIHVSRALINFYIQQRFLIHWRIWLTGELVELWLKNQAYYRSEYTSEKVDNPEQRIQQDVDSFASISLSLSIGLLESVVSLFEFTIILWGLSGALSLFGVEIPRAMIFIVYLYVIIATVFAIKIGRPLIRLNFLNERFNASFRYVLIRLREYGESIAFFGSKDVERVGLIKRFNDVISNTWAIVFRSLKFQGFNLGISQIAVVFPFIIQAPRFLSKQITLGDMMQTAQAFGQVQDALSFFRNAYDNFAAYRAVVSRLIGFLDSIDAVDRLPKTQTEYVAERFSVSSLTVNTPASVALVQNLNVDLLPARSLLIRGRSGVGKTTLLRAIAGLWPYVDGNVTRPFGKDCFFLPQKPYMPLGTLRAALYYPSTPETGEQAAAVLQQCHLGHLVTQLDVEDDWTRILSLGEQQRLAMGRVLLNRPQLVFLDEASSAMDEGLEHTMYRLLRESLPDAILVSVGHRSSLLDFHTQELELLGNGEWRLGEIASG